MPKVLGSYPPSFPNIFANVKLCIQLLCEIQLFVIFILPHVLTNTTSNMKNCVRDTTTEIKDKIIYLRVAID